MAVKMAVECAEADWNGEERSGNGQALKRLLGEEKGQVAVAHVSALAGVGLVAAVLLTAKSSLFMVGVWLAVSAIVTAIGMVISAIAGEEL